MQENLIYDSETDLIPILQIIWRYSAFIAIGTIVATFIALIVAFQLPKVYKSAGFLSVNIPYSTYEKNLDSFTDGSRFLSYLSTRNVYTPQEIANIRYRDPSKLFMPIYDKDPNSSATSTNQSNLLGFEIVDEGSSPQLAQKNVQAVGEFLKDTLLYGDLYEYLNTNFVNLPASLKTIDNSLINDSFNMQLLETKKADLQKMKEKYQTTTIEVRQVFSIKNDGYQFLSPAVEIIKVETAISDLKRERTKLLRSKELAEIQLGFFSKANDLAMKDENKIEEQLLDKILALANSYFSAQILKTDTAREAFNTLTSDLYSKGVNVRFTAGPTISFTPAGPKKKKIVMATFFAALFGFTLLAFLLDWWKFNKQRITEEIVPMPANPFDSTSSVEINSRKKTLATS